MPKSVIYTANQAALSKTANLFAGDTNEFIPYDAIVRVTSVTSAVGINLTIFADTDLLVDDKPIAFVGTSLVDKDHLIDEFEVTAGTRLSVFARETANVATTDHYVAIEVTPV